MIDLFLLGHQQTWEMLIFFLFSDRFAVKSLIRQRSERAWNCSDLTSFQQYVSSCYTHYTHWEGTCRSDGVTMLLLSCPVSAHPIHFSLLAVPGTCGSLMVPSSTCCAGVGATSMPMFLPRQKAGSEELCPYCHQQYRNTSISKFQAFCMSCRYSL